MIHKNVNPRKVKIMATAGIFLSLTMYAYIVSCINNYYSLIIPDEDFRIIKYYFDFTRMQFYKHSEISKMYIYIYKTNQGNIKNIVSFIPIYKRTNVFYFTQASSPHLTFMLMCVHPSIVKYTLELRPVFFSLRVTATRPVRPCPLLLALHLLLIVILLVTPIFLVQQLLVPMSQDTEGSLSPDITGLIISLVMIHLWIWISGLLLSLLLNL